MANPPTVLITGAGRGIGHACAKRFVDSGYTVIVHYNKSKEQALTLPAAIHIQADLSSYDEVSKMFKDIHAIVGGVDILVNCAGISEAEFFDKITLTQWQRVLDTNLSGTFWVTQEASRHMLSQKSGKIINISSVFGLTGASMESHYAAAKAGIIGLTKSLAQELGPSNIAVNCIAPGAVDTDMLSRLSPKDKQHLIDSIPLKRLAAPGEIADLALFLSSPLASYITGQTISISGGWG